MLKAADLGHLARPLAVHKEWVEVLFEEFWRLGDREREAGLDVKPLHDRAGSSPVRVAESQVWFFNAVGVPLFQALVEVLPAARCQLEAVRENCEYWEGVWSGEGCGEGEGGVHDEWEKLAQTVQLAQLSRSDYVSVIVT